MQTPDLFSYRPYWAKRFGISKQLPTSFEEMQNLGWDTCDIVLITGDAYVDHPSFGAALIGRLLEAQGFRVGIIAQPDWNQATDFQRLGKPNLFFGVTGGNMDSMVNRYTSDRRIRTNDAYTPEGKADKRPDRCVLVYAQRCREAFKQTPIVLGGIEASLRRVAHYDYWSDKIRRSILIDAKADLLVFGNGERQVVEIAHRLAQGETIDRLNRIRGTALIVKNIPEGFECIDSSKLDEIDAELNAFDAHRSSPHPTICSKTDTLSPREKDGSNTVASNFTDNLKASTTDTLSLRERDGVRESELNSFTKANSLPLNPTESNSSVIKLPTYEALKDDPVLYAHASRILHRETNPGNAKALIQAHGDRFVWLNPPPIPLTTQEMDKVYGLPFSRMPHHSYEDAKIPAFEMIQHSVTIMRGCFGGCSFCSITEHEGRIIQSRSEESILQEIETIRDNVKTFTGVISDLGGPTANMYRLACKDKTIEMNCRRLSCVYPGICKNLNTDHQPLIKLYRRARNLSGIKKITIGSGVRYDLAVLSKEYVKELAQHHVGGYLKIAPEHIDAEPLAMMMKPGIETYDRFKALFDQYSKEANKEQYLIPYFIAAHPGTQDEHMLNLALWLKKNGFRADQVQAFLPSPMAIATAMYHSGKNPLHKVSRNSPDVFIPKGMKQRRLHKAFLRYHDPDNWPMLREALKRMGRADLIGNGKKHLIPNFQPANGSIPNKPQEKRLFKTQRTIPKKKFHGH